MRNNPWFLRSVAIATGLLVGGVALAGDPEPASPSVEAVTPEVIAPVAEAPPAVPIASVVRIGDDDNWFCTGFYLGNGLVATAGHCADSLVLGPDAHLSVGTSDKQDLKGFVAVGSTPFGGFADFALIRLFEKPPANWTAAKMACGTALLPVGTEIHAEGFPGLVGALLQAWGRIASLPLKIRGAPWRLPVYVAQMPIGKGDSGGPVYGPDNRVVAIMVGAAADQPSFALLQPIEPLCAIVGNTP